MLSQVEPGRMPLREILVHAKSYEEGSEHLDVAARLASAHGARLTALHTLRDIVALKVLLGPNTAAVAERALRARAATSASEERIRAWATERQIVADWMHGEGDAAELLTRTARLFDLLVVEQTDSNKDEAGWDVPEQAALSSGRPTLVVPHAGRFPTVGARAVLAWNHSREATHALHGAMPLLERSDHVTVLEGPARERMGAYTRLPPLDIGEILRRRLPSVEVVPFEPSESNAGADMLEQVYNRGADLLIMGAFGRSWLREWVLGGATRTVLEEMRVPVLLAH